MDKVNKQELRRLCSMREPSLLARDVMNGTILSLLDELEENDGVIAVWRGRLQRAEAELEQYRKDAQRYRWVRESSYVELYCNSPRFKGWIPEHLDAAIDAAMPKEGGANG